VKSLNFPKKIQLKHLFVVMLICIVAFSSVGYILGSNGGTFTLSSGIYPGAPSYTIWREDTVYYAKNAYGVIDYSGTNASSVIYNVIANGLEYKTVSLPYYYGGYATILAPCGSIYLPSDQYELTHRIEIPLGSKIKIEGDGFAMQPIESGVIGGTQIRSSDPDGVLVALDYGTLVNGSDVTDLAGTGLIIRDIEFVQTVNMTASNSVAVELNGMVQGLLQCVSITSYQSWGSEYQGYGLSIFNRGYGAYIQFINVQVYGFYIGMSLTADHLALKGIGVGASFVALQLKPMPHVSIDEVHLFQTNRTIQVAASRTEWPFMANLTQIIKTLYLEQVGTTDNSWVWVGNHSMRIVIEKCQVTYVRPTVWKPYGFENASLWEFHNVNVNHNLSDAEYTTPDFPSATIPSISNNTDIINPNPCQQWVSVAGGTVSSISINGVSTGLTSGSFLLRAEDYINVVYTVEPTTWVWRNFDVSEP